MPRGRGEGLEVEKFKTRFWGGYGQDLLPLRVMGMRLYSGSTFFLHKVAEATEGWGLFPVLEYSTSRKGGPTEWDKPLWWWGGGV